MAKYETVRPYLIVTIEAVEDGGNMYRSAIVQTNFFAAVERFNKAMVAFLEHKREEMQKATPDVPVNMEPAMARFVMLALEGKHDEAYATLLRASENTPFAVCAVFRESVGDWKRQKLSVVKAS